MSVCAAESCRNFDNVVRAGGGLERGLDGCVASNAGPGELNGNWFCIPDCIFSQIGDALQSVSMRLYCSHGGEKLSSVISSNKGSIACVAAASSRESESCPSAVR